MPITKTINFLPAVFQSETNQKFLNATLDQLVTESNLTPINGYVGRKFAPGFSGITTYLRELTEDRADYQLEPSIVVKNAESKEVDFYATYPEILQQISMYGGKTNNQDRLWASEYYTYDPQINTDAFVNFSQYYWLPAGPDTVDIFASSIDLDKTFFIYPDNSARVYNISGYSTVNNPDLVLARGGTYKFNVNQIGKPFWIQTNPGLDGTQTNNNNLSSRDILGVTNNGIDNGTITFTVPSKDAQDFYIKMPIVQTVDFVTTVEYANIQGANLADFNTVYGGFDGQTTVVDGKYVIFGKYYPDDSSWTASAVTVPANQRYGIWQIGIVGGTINLTYVADIPVNNKVTIQYGVTYGNTEWYTNTSNELAQVPVISAPLDTLYYQDGNDANQYGTIRLVEVDGHTIDIDSEILGKINYVSPNGVIFTNGLKIKFDSSVIPESYRNTEFYVDGVGTGISLTPADSLTINFAQSRSNFNPALLFSSAANATLGIARDQMTITSSDMPDNVGVKFGTFPNSANPYSLIEQKLTLNYPYRGGLDTQGDHNSIKLQSGSIAITLPGILINGVSNGLYLQGDYGTRWHYDSNQVLINGQDTYGGMALSDGAYVYRDSTFITANAWGNLSGFEGGSYTHSDGHSKIIGFAQDGYPIYGPFGYVNPSNPHSGTVRMTSSYLANNNNIGRPQSRDVTLMDDAINSNTIIVTDSYGLNPGMRLTVNAAGIEPESAWIISNDLSDVLTEETASSPMASLFGATFTRGYKVTLNKNVSIPAGSTVTFEFLAGAFIEDYEYIPNSGSLDQYNGRYCITPDFPLGTYAYFATQDINNNPVYPYFIGSAYYGSLLIDTDTSLSTPDYIVINRSSKDLNPWSRRNRWFHKDVIDATALYNNTVPLLDQNYRATRPIIEFKPNLQLFNFGKNGLKPIDLYDTRFTQPFLQVEGQRGLSIDSVALVDGMRVIFANDQDPNTRGKIWTVNFVDVVGMLPSDPKVIHLTLATDGNVKENDTISVFNGVQYVGQSFWYDGNKWTEGQVKSTLNQAPMFDVFDSAGVSFGDRTKYPISNSNLAFNGTKIFSYKLGTGSNDSVLGFPLSYKNFNNVGDIVFENNFDSDTFVYTIDKVDYNVSINKGFIYRNELDGTVSEVNVWNTVQNKTRQVQNISYDYDGIDNSFNIDIIPNAVVNTPNLAVYVNYKKLSINDYQIFNIPNNKQQIVINQTKINSGDRVVISIYSNSVSALGYYDIPSNLNLNAKNAPVSALTLGEMRNHINNMADSVVNFVGTYPGPSNLRDLDITNKGGTILQQSAPISYAGMFLTSDKYNFVTSLFNAQNEYARFKNKFLTLAATNRGAAYSDVSTIVDAIIKQINLVKNKSFPWFYSDMVPYGDNKNTLTYNVFDPAQKRYELSEIFSNSTLSNKAVLVYLNGTQLIYELDYTFLADAPGVVIDPSVLLEVNDTITIVEYQNTDGNYVPETPTKLGLYPKFAPEIYTDDTYVTPVTFIRGHDGSLTPAFNDFRDFLLLELETRIYNNIKVSYDEKLFSIYDSIPGKFRDTGYTINEFNTITLKTYLQWVGFNRLDYVSNTTFVQDDPFSYNYSAALDVIDGEKLPGSWRACFEYFYDTQKPHLAPWEMLGFQDMPTWWESYYGPAPYTKGNTILWTDLENGYIADGERKGIDSRFARPGLSRIIPVTESGDLIAPVGLLSNNYSTQSFASKWNVGQWSPTETAWRNSSDYPFAVMYSAAITQPAKFFALGMITNKYRFDTRLNQYVVTDTSRRLTPSDVEVNGYEAVNGTISRASGYLNWIGDHLISNGMASRATLLDFVKGYNVQLSYRMAGFTGKQYLKVLAEQNSPNSVNESVMIPDSDYDLVLGKSVPLSNPKYSGVIVEKTTNGFKISGYDTTTPYFTFIPPSPNGKVRLVRVLDEVVNYPTEFLNYKLSIPYGIEFTTYQQLANFLAGYERYLIAQGFRFDRFDQTLGQIRNWELSTQELVFWGKQNWPVGSVIVLSPVGDTINLRVANAVVDGITNSFYGSKLMTQNFNIMESDAYSIVRDNNNFSLTLDNKNGDLIAFLDIDLVQYEHVLIFNNNTQFNDIIYDPNLGQRQFRLKLVGSKTGGWTGTLAPQGFVYGNGAVEAWHPETDYLRGDLVEYKNFYYTASTNLPGTSEFNFANWLPVDKNKLKSGLLSNFARNASLGRNFYDVDRVNLESEFDKYALGLIGYRNRSYLSDMGLDDTTQVKFYQGFIKEKGTHNAINALATVDYNTQSGNIKVNEEWAFRVGSYGSLDTNQYIELVLDEAYTLSNPTSLEVLDDNKVVYSSTYTKSEGVFKTAKTPWAPPFLLERTSNSVHSDDIQTAGFVNIEDVDYTIFDLSTVETLSADITTVGAGNTIWTAKDFNQTWNVFRVNESNVVAVGITNALDNKLMFTTKQNHNLSVNDVILIPDAGRFTSFYKVLSVQSLTTFIVAAQIGITGFGSTTITSPVYKLQSLRLTRANDIISNTPLNGWNTNNKAWIEKDTEDTWAVYNKTKPWEFDRVLPLGEYSTNNMYGTSVKLSKDNNFALTGKPGYDSGIGAFVSYTLSFSGALREDTTFSAVARNTSQMGYSIDAGVGNVAVGAPGSASNYGYTFIYSRDFTGKLTKKQILAPNVSSGQFGYSLAMSEDDQWLYVGAPGVSNVYVYAYDNSVAEYNESVTKTGYTANLPFTPESTELLFLANATIDFVPYVDYTVSGSVVTFTSDSDSGPILAIQRPGYRYITTLEGNTDSQFGYSIASSEAGDQVVIGAPTDTVVINSVSTTSGTATVYDRSIERFIAPSSYASYTVNSPLLPVSKVYVNNVLQVKGVDYNVINYNIVTFTYDIQVGSIIVIENDAFSMIQNIIPNAPYANHQFGYSVELCHNNCSIYVGAPYQSSNGFYNGAVYRYVNQGKVYGSILGTKLADNVVTPSDSIRINNYEVIFNDTSISSIVNAINGQDLFNTPIPGIKASNVNGYIQITSDSKVTFDKLSVLPGKGTAIFDLGFNVFPQTQIIYSPTNTAYAYFGKTVKVNTNSDALFVGSDVAGTLEDTTFDVALNVTTTFDAGSTHFKDLVATSGSVWTYSYLNDSRNSIANPGQFAFVQQITPYPGLKAQVGFGSAIDVSDFGVLIGSNTDSSTFSNAGKVYQFKNPNRLIGWDPLRVQESKVDISCLLKAYIYSDKNQTIINNLDYIDPAKGKILGVAEQDITFKTDYDPAIYNNASDSTLSLNESFHWTDAQVGQVWWDLSTVKYLDYEQGSIKYRTSNWGRIFPGSSIDVYEWVESIYPPSQYVARGGDGVPKYSNNQGYVTTSYVDPNTNQATVKYYFWVKDKTTVSSNQFGRTIPTTNIAEYIRNPKTSGIKYYAPIRNDSIAVYNINSKLTGRDTILHIDYATILNSNIIHSEYALVSETTGKADSIPQNIYNKLVDSASGIDLSGNPVPDPLIPVQSRYGIDVRPRQSMFVDRTKAIKEMVTFVNSIFAKNIISQGYNLSTLGASESVPPSGIGEYDLQVATIEELSFINVIIQPNGYKVLVTSDSTVDNLWTIYTKQADNTWLLSRVQSYRASDYWKYIDWYAPGFDAKVQPNFTVNTFADLSKIPVRSENIVKIKNNGQGKWVLVQIFPNVVTTIGIQDGTIALTENLYKLTEYGMGFGNDNFGAARFDQNPSIETRKILQALRDDIFINELSEDFLQLFFVFVYYVLDEQKYVDWAFKTSFIDILHKFKGLDQPQIYNKDNQTYYEQYIEEVKPYRTTIREYVLDYQGADNFNGYASDFDVPAYYDTVLNQYRSPSGEFAEDVKALQTVPYRDWLLNYSYVVDTIDILDGGTGYTIAPQITLTGSTIGNDAVARALITNGTVTKVEVLYSGTNYVTQPTITVSGGNGSGARVYARLKNEVIRKLKTTLVYDRITYGSQVYEWAPQTAYKQGDIVTYKNVAYLVNRNFTSGATFLGNNLSIYPANKFTVANDRIQAYYSPELGQPGKDFGLLQSGINYPGVTVEGPLFSESGSFDIAGFDANPFDPLEVDADGTYIISDALLDTKISSAYTDLTLGTRPEDIIVDGGEYVDTYSSHAPEELLPGRVYDTLDITVSTFATLANTVAYTNWVNNTGFYVYDVVLNDGGLGYITNANTALGESNLSVTVEGTTGTDATIGYTLNANGSIQSLTVISSGIGYTTMPNVRITGSNLSPASASLRLAQNQYDIFDYRIFKDMNDNYSYLRIPNNAQTTLAETLTLTANTISVVNASVLPEPNPSGAVPGVVFINGERITYYSKNNATNTLGQIRRATAGTGAKVHTAGSAVVSANADDIIPQSDNYNAVVDANANVTVSTTATLPYTFEANVEYIHSTLWYNQGVGPDTLEVEFITNVAANIMTTESSIEISTNQSNIPRATDGNGLFASNKIQALFVKQL